MKKISILRKARFKFYFSNHSNNEIALTQIYLLHILQKKITATVTMDYIALFINQRQKRKKTNENQYDN